MRNITLMIGAMLSLVASSLPGTGAPARPIIGTLILAKENGNALLIWDCTRELASLVARKTKPEDEIKTLKTDAVRALLQNSKRLAKTATTLTVRVVYNRVGEIDPRYGTPTFQGVERLMMLEAPVPLIPKAAASWIHAIETASPTKGLTVQVTGKVPGQK